MKFWRLVGYQNNSMKTKKIYIQGMHCPSCEKLLEGEFKNVAGVRNVKVDRKTDSADIFFDDKEPDVEEIKNIAEKFGYTAFENKLGEKNSGKKRISNWQDWLKAAVIVLAISFLYRFFQASGLANGISANNKSISYGAAFLVGLVASVSSCLAVVGAVVIAFSEKYSSKKSAPSADAARFFESAIRSNLFFHIGRLGTFFVLGGLLGALGGELNISGNFMSTYIIIIAVVMAWLGLNILGLVPSLSAVGIRMPGRFNARWEDLKKSEHLAAPFVLGGLTFFLPCGFTQSMQLFALASGSFLVGGLSLFFFALGTAPILLAVGAAASWTKNKGLTVFQKVAGVLIILFAVYTFNSGLALKGVKTNVVSSKNIQENEAQNQIAPQLVQIITMNVTAAGFEPSVLAVKQGTPVKWVINGVNVTGCTSTIIVPSFNISKNLKLGENIVQFTPQSKGVINFSCGMGMVRGKFIVE
jgi:uncharacterized protein